MPWPQRDLGCFWFGFPRQCMILKFFIRAYLLSAPPPPPPCNLLPGQLALRAGNEKEEGETADTVGCCSLRVEHINLHPELDGQEYVVEFDFLGKDSIRYYNKVPVEKRVSSCGLSSLACFCFHSLFSAFPVLCVLLNTRKNGLKEWRGTVWYPVYLLLAPALYPSPVLESMLHRVGPHHSLHIMFIPLCCFNDITTLWYPLVVLQICHFCSFAQLSPSSWFSKKVALESLDPSAQSWSGCCSAMAPRWVVPDPQSAVPPQSSPSAVWYFISNWVLLAAEMFQIKWS